MIRPANKLLKLHASSLRPRAIRIQSPPYPIQGGEETIESSASLTGGLNPNVFDDSGQIEIGSATVTSGLLRSLVVLSDNTGDNDESQQIELGSATVASGLLDTVAILSDQSTVNDDSQQVELGSATVVSGLLDTIVIYSDQSTVNDESQQIEIGSATVVSGSLI